MLQNGETTPDNKYSAKQKLAVLLLTTIIVMTIISATLYNTFLKSITLTSSPIVFLINNIIITGIAVFFTYRTLIEKLEKTIKTHQEIEIREETLQTYQKQLETQNEELRKLTQAVEQSANTIVITDLQGHIEYANPKFTEVTGYTIVEAIGKKPRILKSGQQPKEYYENLWKTITAGKEWRGEFHNRRKDGTYYWEQATIAPIYNTLGEITHFIAVKEDITARKEAEEKLKEAKEKAEAASRAKGTFVANMSHELRTPLNAILGFTQLLRRNKDLPQDAQQHLATIHRSGEHLLTLINQVLDLSKIEAGHVNFNRTAFNLLTLSNEIQDMFYLQAQQRGLELIFEHEPDVPVYIYADKIKLRQVLINLLNNALKFTKTGYIVVRISSLTEKSPKDDMEFPHCHLYFEVKDTGSGIQKDELDTIFEAFVQAPNEALIREGTGLGLPISRSLVKLMGGELTVNSTPGKGSTFSFDLRVQIAQAEDRSPRTTFPKKIAAEVHQAQHRILIVDDAEDNRQLINKLLTPLGFKIQEAHNGQEAISIWQEWKPDLIYMDIQMPVLNGYKATAYIKKHSVDKIPVIIAITANVLGIQRQKILECGCDDIIYKPFSPNTIFEMLHKHLGVDFIYEGTVPETASPPKKTYTDAMFIKDLQKMSEHWRQELETATILLNAQAVQETLDKAPEQVTELTEALRRLVDTFNYKKILTLLQRSRKEMNNEQPIQ